MTEPGAGVFFACAFNCPPQESLDCASGKCDARFSRFGSASPGMTACRPAQHPWDDRLFPCGRLASMIPPVLDTLAATPFLTGLGEPALSLLAREGTVRDFAPDELIVREGEEGHSFFVIVEGDVEIIMRYGSPHAVMLARLHRGTFFGEMCVVDPVPRAATARALSHVTLIEIKAATLYHLFQKMPDQYAIMLLNLARDMARRLRALEEAFAAKTS